MFLLAWAILFLTACNMLVRAAEKQAGVKDPPQQLDRVSTWVGMVSSLLVVALLILIVV